VIWLSILQSLACPCHRSYYVNYLAKSPSRTQRRWKGVLFLESCDCLLEIEFDRDNWGIWNATAIALANRIALFMDSGTCSQRGTQIIIDKCRPMIVAARGIGMAITPIGNRGRAKTPRSCAGRKTRN
jgi:hypothetical protein